MLEVTESAGEAAFPILSRWEDVGLPLLSTFLSTTFRTTDKVSYFQSQLIHSIIKMLRGTTTSIPSTGGISSTSTIISTGPSSHGRRARSYSFGKSDGVGALKSYPSNMQASIVTILTKTTDSALHNEIRTCLFEIVLSSQSWRKKVFSNLSGKVRQKIASALLVAATEFLFHGVDSVLLSLPLDANDIAKLLCDQESSDVGLSKQTFIFDFVNTNHSKLATSPGINELLASIFKTLSGFSEGTEDGESIKFARHALLSALLELIKSSLDTGSMNTDLGTKKKTFDSWLNILLDTVVQKRTSDTQFVSFRSKRIIFLIFATLCDKYPRAVIPKFIPIINGLVSQSLSQGEESTLISCFDLIIPVYFRHAGAGNLSPIDLFRSFIDYMCNHDEKTRLKFYAAFVHGLSMIPQNDDSGASPVGSFLCAVLARESYNSSDKASTDRSISKLPELATQILSQTSSDLRIQAVWTMQNYAKETLFNILQEESSSTSGAIFSVQHLIEIAEKGPNSTGEISPNQSLSEASSSVVDSLCSLYIVVTCEVVTSHELRNIIRRTDGSGSTIILRLWQDLLLIQSACHNRLGGSSNHDKSEMLGRIVEITTQALDCIQNSIQSHIFLAFVTNLVTEGETQELRARAVQLIAERSASAYMGKSEAVLFMEMIPPLLQLLVPDMSDDMNEESDRGFLHQSVFAAIDSIGRNACLSSESIVNDRHLGIFSEATFKAASALQKESRSIKNVTFLDIPSESRQLISSAALCSSTTIKICGPRALPVLPTLMKPLLTFLDAASTFIESSITESDNVDKKELSQAKLMQLAILRTLKSIVERMPKLLKPYLVDILKTFAKVSGGFRGDSLNQSQSIQMEIVALQNVMTSNVPTRQLIPAASKSISSNLSVELNLPILSTMIESVTNSKSSEVSGMISLIIKTATQVFDQDDTQEGGSAVMQAADELLLSLVMKLSEVQLRSLYRKIREWRGDLDEANPEQTAGRRSAFWRFSSTLSKQLKSIYLSCLTTVFSDAVDELEMAARSLSKKDSIKKADGKKRQKILGGEVNISFEASSLQALKNLLRCLEVSLRSDAHEGGVWIRELESQRYDKLLEPLGKLLHCRLSDSAYGTIVQGNESQSGSVVECLVALGTAAGDEQLWKPLNHAVLQACSDENRLEVRKAGVSCLLSLINSIGEEYMVLIPECLPVLSELLEDPDEEVAGTAQECISQSEELLGESLQDSLL
jgi:U3 small nucleolar RNA-associated protein 10